LGSAADADPNRQWILKRTRIDRLFRERSAVLSTPPNMGVITNLEKKVELF
jgi:hypothetical protein